MRKGLLVLLVAVFCLSMVGCLEQTKTDSGITKVTVNIPIQPNGMTIEQQNVHDRLLMDNKPGSIKHLYIISAYSGDVLIYSTVKGKVTSSGKRLNPQSVGAGTSSGAIVNVGGFQYYTNELVEDDGTFGNSVPYIYWWDSKGIYHQHYPEGGQMIHISDQPLAIKNVIINMELTK